MTRPVEHEAASLARDGYCVIEQAADPALIARINAGLDARFAATPMCQGNFYGPRTKRFGTLLTRAPETAALVMNEGVLAIVEGVLLPWCDRIALNLAQAIEIHPGALAQAPHRDQDMWGGPKGTIEYLVNVMWPLAPFARENGGTRLWPGSHVDPDLIDVDDADAIVPRLMPGDALLLLGSTLHGGGGNRTANPRRGIVISYCLGWLKPFELQWLVYPPAVARQFPPELASLVGYALHRPNLGNVEGQCPSLLLSEAIPDHAPAIDALRPDQAEAVAAFVRGQLGEMG
ncbi:ectoine hydroxylase-related dioxygenase (phytanoyl-CoA dioxygenase family) [Novosphingobium fluoreni]|uniref:Ectoine hydroxylase-related dioxygenase (Phytanoyl-CoA dioxygenase family) n=1 Tax=Novosphingobium fluoreni TaxID=1391222 RepID=A0A7W6FZA2_9SPHN|nr:phytanoyl-CoA dioxygenase family protein [Novosphingobium fluoreni]MBB3941294.1 ectoine hydroxylase-related dioxygenase (phytanoyl-CoA dioxygenase family) [Novosphingobium fluoreni]